MLLQPYFKGQSFVRYSNWCGGEWKHTWKYHSVKSLGLSWQHFCCQNNWQHDIHISWGQLWTESHCPWKKNWTWHCWSIRLEYAKVTYRGNLGQETILAKVSKLRGRGQAKKLTFFVLMAYLSLRAWIIIVFMTYEGCLLLSVWYSGSHSMWGLKTLLITTWLKAQRSTEYYKGGIKSKFWSQISICEDFHEVNPNSARLLYGIVPPSHLLDHPKLVKFFFFWFSES